MATMIMLSRVADSLYWMSRYVERAENIARILDAHDEIFVNTPAKSQTSGTLQWSAILRSCSAHDAYRKFYVAQVDPDKVVEFLILNEFFPRSIRSCVQALNEGLRRISGAGDGSRSHHKDSRSAGVDGDGGTSPAALRPAELAATRLSVSAT